MPRKRKSRNPRRQTHPTPRDSGLRSPGMERPLLPNASGTGAVKLPITSPAQDGPPRPDRLTPVRLSAIRPAGRIHSSRCRTTGSLVASLRPSWGAHTPAGEPAANSCLSLISRGGIHQGLSARPTPSAVPGRPCPIGNAPDPMEQDAPVERDGRWSKTGSNRRPHACKARALPTELLPRSGPMPAPEGAAGLAAQERRDGRGPHDEPAWTGLHGLACTTGGHRLVGLGRLELPTSRLSSARSNQLSYKPLSDDTRPATGRQGPKAPSRSRSRQVDP